MNNKEMRDLLENVLYYKAIHPIRFWGGIIACIILTIFLSFLMKRFLQYKSAAKASLEIKEPNNIIDSNHESLIGVNDSLKTEFSHLNNNKYIDIVPIIIIVLIGIFSVTLIFNSKMINENLSISNSRYVFGIDVSHYQGKIDWTAVRTSHHPIEFVFIRATMGIDGKDSRFSYNWLNAKDKSYVRGAYHYYRPNENAIEQFNNYASSVNIEIGDFTPILDIEKSSKFGSENLRKGVLKWLELAEIKYGIKPIIYTGRTFYHDHLSGYVDDYPLWIASYSGKHKLNDIQWTFHQFTERVRVKGIKTRVDGNDFHSTLIDLKSMCLK